MSSRTTLALVAAAALAALTVPSVGLADDCHSEHEVAEAHEPLPGMSVYLLDDPWVTQSQELVSLEDFRGHPVVVLMFFGSCQHACPILVSDLQRLDAALTEDDAQRTRYLLVTIDPERDTPETLQQMSVDYALDPTRWTFLHGREAQIRELAAVLGVQYRQTADGGYAHSNLITVLDFDGVVVEQLEGLAQPVDPLVEAIHALSLVP